jgi:hypothetical protein
MRLNLLFLLALLTQGCSAIIYNGFENTTTVLSVNECCGLDGLASLESTNFPIQLDREIPVSKKMPKKATKKVAATIKSIKSLGWEIENVRWEVNQNKGLSTSKSCSLSTATIQIDEHNYTTQLWLNIIDNKLYVNTTTDFDIHESIVGIQTQNGAIQPFSNQIFSNSAEWSGSVNKTIKMNDALRITIGGTDLGRNTHQIAIGLGHLKEIYPSYSRCRKGLQVSTI